MLSNDEYDDMTDVRALLEHGYAVDGYEKEVGRHSFTSEDTGDFDGPPVLSPPHIIDISSIRRPPVLAMVPTDRASAHDLPLAPLAVVERELFHNCTFQCKL